MKHKHTWNSAQQHLQNLPGVGRGRDGAGRFKESEAWNQRKS